MEARIKRNIFIVIGVTFLVLVGMVVAWGFLLDRPTKGAIATARKQYDDSKKAADKLGPAKVSLAKAKQEQQFILAQLAFFRGSDTDPNQKGRYRSLYFDMTRGKDPNRGLNLTWRNWMHEYYSDFGSQLSHKPRYGEDWKGELIAAADDSGVTLSTTLKVDAPPRAPEAVAIPAGTLLKPVTGGSLGVTVIGTLDNIMQFFTRINQSSILMTVGAIKLDGYSPRITATFTLTPYLLARGKDVKLAAAAAAPAEGVPGSGSPDSRGSGSGSGSP